MDANGYLASFDPAEQQRIRQSWAGNPNGLQDWFRNAVAAGAVQGQRPAGTQSGMLEGGWEDNSRGDKFTTVDFTGVAQPQDWLGKRMPTPAEARLWAQQQHAAYTGGNRQAQDEDWNRYSDQQIGAWLNEGWDPATGGWKQGFDAHGQIMPWAQQGTVGTTAALPMGTPQAWQGAQSPQSNRLSQIMAAYQSRTPQTQTPQVSSQWSTGGYGDQQLQNMQSSLQGLLQAPTQAQTAPKPVSQGGGWASTQGGLTGMMAPYQKRQVKTSWF